MMIGVLVVPFRGQNAVLVALRAFSFKSSTVVAYAVPFRVYIKQRFLTMPSKTFKRRNSAIEVTQLQI